ncbi:MAG: zinc-dependent metalloprotease [Bacteroidetes bacterium]|nr:zinc-dependent metalloprotease [Bacteroidota bacterium]
MFKKVIFLFLIFLSLCTKAQIDCGTPETSYPKDFRPETIEFSNDIVCVSVQFHIVKDNNGNSSVTNASIEQLLTLLNTHFNPHNIYIKNAGVDSINSSLYFNMTDSQFNSLIKINNNPNAVNFYIVNSCTSWAGKAEDIISKNLVMTMPYLISGVSSHELGHCLNLWHTFQGTRPGTSGCAEAINGSNCYSCGDYVCDTPADQNYGNANGYSPDMTNNMSYYSPYTLDHFTPMQGERMRNALHYSTVLNPVVNLACSKINGPDTICENSTINYTLDNPFGINVNWSVSSNLQIISSNQNDISISSIFGGSGVITANFQNGLILTKNIWIGKPVFNDLILTDNLQVPYCLAPPEPLITTINANNAKAIFDGLSNSEILNNTNWEWKTSNNKILLNGTKNSRTICPMFVGFSSFKVRAKNSCGWSEWYELPEFEISLLQSTTMKNSNNIFSIYPNPASDIVYIEQKNPNKIQKNDKLIDVEILDLTGNTKIKTKLNSNKTEIKTNHLEKGVYIINIYIDNKIEKHQVIIK